MVDSATLQDRLDRLEAAIATGSKSVQYADRQITYRSLNEMQAIANRIQNQIAKANSATRNRRLLAEFNRGY